MQCTVRTTSPSTTILAAIKLFPVPDASTCTVFMDLEWSAPLKFSNISRPLARNMCVDVSIIPTSTSFGGTSDDNLPRSARKRTLADGQVDDAEARHYAKRKFNELQSSRPAKGRCSADAPNGSHVDVTRKIDYVIRYVIPSIFFPFWVTFSAPIITCHHDLCFESG